MTLEQLAPRLTQPLVRSLAWLIGSPNLLDEDDARFAGRLVSQAWGAQALAGAAPWLLALDSEPQPLLDHIAAQGTRRLGRMAEALLGFWLAHQSDVEVLARNLPVRDAQRTLGEFDVLFRRAGEAVATHWELAVKFYLAQETGTGFSGYVGTGMHDVLGAKVARVFDRQLVLGASPEGRAVLASRGISELRAQGLIKGWLFYPHGSATLLTVGLTAGLTGGLNAMHGRGWWMRAGPGWEQQLDAHARYAILPRLDWLAWPWLAVQEDLLSREGLAACLENTADAALIAVMAPGPHGWVERERGFVVPAGWGRVAAP